MLKNKKSRPAHSQIAEYWKDKYISSDYKIIDHFEANAVPVIADWGEPECLACGEFNESIYQNPKYEKFLNQNRGVFRVWNLPEAKNFLQRCHIIPRMLDGENEVANYFLLCKECHQESPDYYDSRYFFAYVRYVRQNRHTIIQNRNKNLLKAVYTLALQMNKNILNLENVFYDSTIKSEKMGLHITSFSVYTIAAAVIDMLDELDLEKVTEIELKAMKKKYLEYGINWDAEEK